MSIVRMKFSKGEEIKYISHLDIQRCFQRLFRRVNLDMSYSQGFNPHPKLSFAMAMPVGMTSKGEYLDVEVEDDIDIELVKNKLNDEAPRGLEVLQVKIMSQGIKSLSATITTGLFNITIYKNIRDINDTVADTVKKVSLEEKIEIQKKNKKGIILTKDIRPLIKDITIINNEVDHITIKLECSIGSNENLNPQILIDYLIKKCPVLNEFPKARIHRIDMFIDKEVTPIDL